MNSRNSSIYNFFFKLWVENLRESFLSEFEYGKILILRISPKSKEIELGVWGGDDQTIQNRIVLSLTPLGVLSISLIDSIINWENFYTYSTFLSIIRLLHKYPEHKYDLEEILKSFFEEDSK